MRLTVNQTVVLLLVRLHRPVLLYFAEREEAEYDLSILIRYLRIRAANVRVFPNTVDDWI
jgi:hypothetical protein